MSDLVGNPEDRFSRVTAQMRNEKTGLRGFRPGLTQTGLFSLRKRLEAINFEFK